MRSGATAAARHRRGEGRGARPSDPKVLPSRARPQQHDQEAEWPDTQAPRKETALCPEQGAQASPDGSPDGAVCTRGPGQPFRETPRPADLSPPTHRLCLRAAQWHPRLSNLGNHAEARRPHSQLPPVRAGQVGSEESCAGHCPDSPDRPVNHSSHPKTLQPLEQGLGLDPSSATHQRGQAPSLLVRCHTARRQLAGQDGSGPAPPAGRQS